MSWKQGNVTLEEKQARAVELKRKDPELTLDQLMTRLGISYRALVDVLKAAGLYQPKAAPERISMRGQSRSKREARERKYRAERKASS